jgi:hypothetical protein
MTHLSATNNNNEFIGLLKDILNSVQVPIMEWLEPANKNGSGQT